MYVGYLGEGFGKKVGISIHMIVMNDYHLKAFHPKKLDLKQK